MKIESQKLNSNSYDCKIKPVISQQNIFSELLLVLKIFQKFHWKLPVSGSIL